MARPWYRRWKMVSNERPEMVSVSGLEFFAVVSPIFMSWCWNALAFPALISPAVLHPRPLAMVEEFEAIPDRKFIEHLLIWCKKQIKHQPVWAFPSDDPAQGAQAGVLCLPSKRGCDHSEKYPRQGLIYWWVFHVGQEQLPVRKSLPWRFQWCFFYFQSCLLVGRKLKILYMVSTM